MASLQNLVSRFFDNTAGTYDRVVAWTTFGKDDFWKKEIIRQIPAGQSFLDLGCGTGILTRKIAQKFPLAKIIGLDLTQSYLEIAKKNSSLYKNMTFFHQDAEKIELDTRFDCIVSSYVPKYCDPQTLVKNCIEHLNQNGKIILHDFIYPKNKTTRVLWDFYFVILNFVGHFMPDWKEAFSELPKLIRKSNWPVLYKKELSLYGFDVKIQCHTWNCVSILTATRI